MLKGLKIGDLEIKLPIIQGGMGIGVSMSGLASAVANEGGVGVISAAGIGMFEPDYAKKYLEANLRRLKGEIQKAREKTNGVLGVNIMVALSDFADLVKTSIAEGIDIIFSGAGLPLNLPEFRTPDSKTKLVPIISSGRAAKLLCNKWKNNYDYIPDAFVIEGPKAGGHLGFKYEQLEDPNFQLENLLVEVKENIKDFEEEHNREIPIIVAGGVYSGADIKDMIDRGASGVQMGTRFVTTHECDASEKFKQTFVDANEDDLTIIKSPVGMPGRAIKGTFIDKVNRGEKKPIKCPYKFLRTCNVEKTPYCIVAALVSAMKGNLNGGFAFAGTNAYKTKAIISVKETFQNILAEYNAAVAKG